MQRSTIISIISIYYIISSTTKNKHSDRSIRFTSKTTIPDEGGKRLTVIDSTLFFFPQRQETKNQIGTKDLPTKRRFPDDVRKRLTATESTLSFFPQRQETNNQIGAKDLPAKRRFPDDPNKNKLKQEMNGEATYNKPFRPVPLIPQNDSSSKSVQETTA